MDRATALTEPYQGGGPLSTSGLVKKGEWEMELSSSYRSSAENEGGGSETEIRHG